MLMLSDSRLSMVIRVCDNRRASCPGPTSPAGGMTGGGDMQATAPMKNGRRWTHAVEAVMAARLNEQMSV